MTTGAKSGDRVALFLDRGDGRGLVRDTQIVHPTNQDCQKLVSSRQAMRAELRYTDPAAKNLAFEAYVVAPTGKTWAWRSATMGAPAFESFDR